MQDRAYDWAARAAAQVVNLNLADKPPCERFQAVQRVFLATMRLAVAEQRETMLEPSEN